MKKLPLTLLEMRASSDMWKLVHRVVLKSENYHMTIVNTLEDMCISEYQNRLMTYEMKENCRPLLLCVRHHCYAYPPILTAPDSHSATKKWQHIEHQSQHCNTLSSNTPRLPQCHRKIASCAPNDKTEVLLNKRVDTVVLHWVHLYVNNNVLSNY